jgi:serine/threonine-protein kinase
VYHGTLEESARLVSPRIVGRYQVHEAFASGGMASVHFGRAHGAAGFARIVAVKQLHPSFAEDAATVSTLLDEARLVSRIQHPSVVATLDVLVDGADILLVLEYVHGESLARLLRASPTPPPVPVVTAVLADALHGLHAAHEARGEDGEPLGIVHRDVSPQNVMVGVDGLGRVIDFGVAKARGRLQTTREGQVKGKLAYMAPEQIRAGEVTRRTDVFAAGVVAWEALTGARLFAGENEGHVITQVLNAEVAAPSARRASIGAELDAVVLRALQRDPQARWATARDFAVALERCGTAPGSDVGRWVEDSAGPVLAERAARVAEIERSAAARSLRERAPRVVATSDEVTATATVAAAPANDDVTATATVSAAPAADDRSRPHASGDAPRPRKWAALAAIAVTAAVVLAMAASRAGGGAVDAAGTTSEAAAPAEAPTAAASAGDPPASPVEVRAPAAADAAPPVATPPPGARPAPAPTVASSARPKSATRDRPAAASAAPPAASPPPPSASADPFYRFE